MTVERRLRRILSYSRYTTVIDCFNILNGGLTVDSSEHVSFNGVQAALRNGFRNGTFLRRTNNNAYGYALSSRVDPVSLEVTRTPREVVRGYTSSREVIRTSGRMEPF